LGAKNRVERFEKSLAKKDPVLTLWPMKMQFLKTLLSLESTLHGDNRKDSFLSFLPFFLPSFPPSFLF
jgi:hypothetical protein